MNKQLKSLQLRQAEEFVAPWRSLSAVPRPTKSLIRLVRQALGMSTTQLGRRMGVSRQAIAHLERREVDRTATLAILERAADALDAELIYAIVPRGSLESVLDARITEKARHQVERAAHGMRLEAQGVGNDEIARQVQDQQEKLRHSWTRTLWDDDTPPRAGKGT